MSAQSASPLLALEQRVQAATKDRISGQDRTQRRDLIGCEVRRQIDLWNSEYKLGQQSVLIDSAGELANRVVRNISGYGPLEPLIEDADVWEICINAPDQIFVKRHNGMSGYHDEVFHDEDHVVRTLTRIMDEATGTRRKFDPALGLQDAQLPSGARMHIVHSDLGRGGHTVVNIRKFSGVAIKRLDELVSRSMLTRCAGEFLRAAVQARLSIVFAGAPGSGKTTLLSCCAAELDPSLRVVTAEEVFEADIPLPNVASLQTRAKQGDRSEIDLRALVSGFLRMAPDVAIVGEVRDREALPLLLTLSSGVTGYTTIHSGSARKALSRLRFIAQLADTSSELPMTALNSLVSESIDLVVHTARDGDRVGITEIVAVEDIQAGADSATFTTTSLFERDTQGGELRWSGNLPIRCRPQLEHVGYRLEELGDQR
jgi:pilus assembly protein CpaF